MTERKTKNPPSTSSLWISEGLTSYFGELIVVRAGLGSTEDYLRTLSLHIDRLQDSPGRLMQTLEQSSLEVWSSGTSGVGRLSHLASWPSGRAFREPTAGAP
jgi:predicted metalloprotease with PDZ domain